MDHTSRMTALLGSFRRERNGLVADTMQYRGHRYGLNYGVSLPTVRTLARAEPTDHPWAQFLYLQDVRELRLAALWIADPIQITSGEFSLWAAGITNSEVAEECALALLARAPRTQEWAMEWSESDDELLQYAALLGLSRTLRSEVEHLPWGEWCMSYETLVSLIRRVMTARPDSPLLAHGVVALLSSVILDPRGRSEVEALLPTLARGESLRYVQEELCWRLQF